MQIQFKREVVLRKARSQLGQTVQLLVSGRHLTQQGVEREGAEEQLGSPRTATKLRLTAICPVLCSELITRGWA